MKLGDLPTPALLVDLDVLERNVDRMAAKAAALGVRLRPHVKTHKCLEIARLQRRHGARGITVATLAEAEDFAAGGFDDITWAFPLVPARLEQALSLARRITLRLVVDSAEALDAVVGARAASGPGASAPAGPALHVWLKVDCGFHRAGVSPAAPGSVDLARRIAETPCIAFDGILTHAGHAYRARSREGLARIAAEERAIMVEFAERLRAAGVAVPAVSIGSTPTMAVVEDLSGVDEVRPGNYVFYDYIQAANGVCALADCAVTVLASVVSHQRGAGHVVVDAGALALSKDAGPSEPSLARGLGPVFRDEGARVLDEHLQILSVSQEHGLLGSAGAEHVEGRLAVGERVRILPNHSCLTAAMFDEYQVVRGEDVVDRWKIWRRR